MLASDWVMESLLATIETLLPWFAIAAFSWAVFVGHRANKEKQE